MHKLAVGKRNEFRVWAWLIDEGFDVYPSLVDDKGIDGIVGCNGKYFEIQIKSGKSWSNQRGLGHVQLSRSLERIYLIFNYTTDEVRYFTAQEILNEPDWHESIRWKMPQIKLPQKTLEKYKDHDWDGFLTYLRSKANSCCRVCSLDKT